LDLYQISIEDERGTEVFIVIDELDTSPMLSEADFTVDVSGLSEVDGEEFWSRFALRIVSYPAMEEPMAVDLYASSHQVARTGMATIKTDGFDTQDAEDQLTCEVECRSPGGAWTLLETIQYSGLAPLGHWDATFAPGETAELGAYSFRVRYIDSSGNASEWLESLDIVTVKPAPPRIVRTIPIRAEQGVHVSADITVTFSKPMDKDTVESNFSVVSESGRIILGSSAWDADTFIFAPAGDLEYHMTYLARITGEARSADGIGLDGNYDTASDGIPYDDYIWTFRTSAAPPMLKFEPSDKSVRKGDWFQVRIMAKYVVGMHKFSFRLAFDPEVLEIKKVDRASFASWRPRPKSIGEADLWAEPVIDRSGGSITMACYGTREGGVSGSGYLATLGFSAIGLGTASLGFQEVLVADSRGQPIDVELLTAEIQVIEFDPLDVNHDGVVNILDFAAIASGEDSGSQGAPCGARFALEQNFPNPFNPETWVPYQLARQSAVTIRIYRPTGELVRTLDLGQKEAGFYSDKSRAAYWDGTDDTGQRAGSGVYFYTIQADGFAATRKMLLRM
jgi:hypothetical protein